MRMRLFHEVPMLVKVGALCGFCAGLPIGMMVSAGVGLLFGISLGVSCGIVCGIVMDRDEKRAQHRTRELDEIIGVTSGNLGSTPESRSLPPPAEPSWLEEWMTPRPPQVGA